MGEADFTGDSQPFGLGLTAFELDPAFQGDGLDAIQPGQEVEVPELAPEFSVRDAFEADCLLPGITFWIERSSMEFNSATSVSRRSCRARASLSGSGRSRLPT